MLDGGLNHRRIHAQLAGAHDAVLARLVHQQLIELVQHLGPIFARQLAQRRRMRDVRRPEPGLVHHSDRGCQYTSLTFGRRCREAGILPSMGRRGDASDNALAESFFATLETELLTRQSFPHRGAARLAIFDYLEGFYNSHRRHSALGYLAPAEFERRWEDQIRSQAS
jgi:transposase InsO family protein